MKWKRTGAKHAINKQAKGFAVWSHPYIYKPISGDEEIKDKILQTCIR